MPGSDTDTDAKLKSLHHKRGNVQGAITRFMNKLYDWAETEEDRDPDLLQASLESLQKSFEKFESIQEQLEELDSDNETPQRAVIQDNYDVAVARARKYLRQSLSPLNDSFSTNAPARFSGSFIAPQSTPVKLPSIKIPQFSGNIEDWASFYDIFSSLIDKNPDIPNVSKLTYLKRSLTGKAVNLLDSVKTTDANYKDALEFLKNKFDCPRRALRKHWSILREYPKLSKDTPAALNSLVETFQQHLKALENLGAPTKQWDVPLIDLVLTKIGPHTTFQWELTLEDNNMPSFLSLLSFLEKRANSVALTSAVSEPPSKPNNRSNQNNSFQASTHSTKSAQTYVTTNTPSKNDNKNSNKKCSFCGADFHYIYKCEKYLAMPVDERKKVVLDKSLCLNCLGPKKRCQNNNQDQCRSQYRCRTCSQCHHSTLCLEKKTETETKTATSLVINTSNFCDLITTAKLHVLNNEGKPVECRTLLDSCSTQHFITERLAKKLGLRKTQSSMIVDVLNGVTTRSSGVVTATIQSKINNYQKTLTFRTVENIANLVPDQPINRRDITIPKNIKLADEEFDRPSAVQMLLNSGTTLSLLCQGQIKLSNSNNPDLYLQKTLLGWVIGGSAPSSAPSSNPHCHVTTASLDFDLDKFWSIEEGPVTQHLSEEENFCEEHFKNHFYRNADGRYVVGLPFNDKVSQLGNSKPMAQKRLRGIKRKLSLDPELKTQYFFVMQEYLTLSHMSRVDESQDQGQGPFFYLPHHAVKKEGSLTTALRVVYDGSAQSDTGLSLNDTLSVGPTIQPDLFCQLLKFREHCIVLTGDIEKMYRQFLVRPEDRKYQRILWFDSEWNEVTYELNTITFGLGPSSFLSIRCVHQLADDEKDNFPLASPVLKGDFYVDNALTGKKTVAEAIELRKELTGILATAGINIYQWASNSPAVLEGLPPEKINKHLILNNSTINTLGVKWNADDDTITYTVAKLDPNPTVTKRIILSEISKIFDPLGLLAPVIIFAKILIQELWKLNLHWDETLPLNLRSAWLKYRQQLFLLQNLTFSRKVLIDEPVCVELHGFCDSSEKAYGCCVYVKSSNDLGNIQVTLLCSKSRVAPLKKISIPRLELCGAKILTELVCCVSENMRTTFDKYFFWTDSSTVLNWLHTCPASLQVFVANRVSFIQTKTNLNDWRHVSTVDNPADLVTRAQQPKNLLNCELWQHGPSWLSLPETEWPASKFTYDPENVPEMKRSLCFHANSLDTSLFERYSSILSLQKTVALCLRMKNKNKHSAILKGPERETALKTAHITVSELNSALNKIISVIQANEFPEELQCFKTGKPLNFNSRLLSLNPFLDPLGLIRVGGRLQNATLPYSQRHPLLLPKSNYVTHLLIEAEHKLNLHAGVQATLYALRRRFWLIDGRNEVRKILRKCVPCAKLRPITPDHLMGQLPAARVTPCRPFACSGVDFAGPFFLKEKKYRNRTQIKAWVSVFVCFVSRAVHLELVTELTTEAFIAALKRFIARRGLCTDVYSDNGTNFVGANNQIKELNEFLKDEKHQSTVNSFARDNNIQWHFIPVRSPHYGGLWEAAVKSFKHHLAHVVGKTLFTYEQFSTFLCEVEACLNSRPLSPMSADPNDLLVLTPGHFLIGDSLKSLPNCELRDAPVNRLSHWQHLEQMRQHFWSRWSREYLNELTVRHKWTKNLPNIQEGTLVLLKEENRPPLQWVMGRVIECHPGQDGVTRVVTVKTARNPVKLSVRKVAPLPIELLKETPTVPLADDTSNL